jgi:hypothetical protein
MKNSSKHRTLKELVELRKQHARNMNSLRGLTKKQIAHKYLHEIYAKPNQHLQHATEALGHFNSEGNFINAPKGITTGVWNNTTANDSTPFAHAVKFVPPNHFKIPNVRTRRKNPIHHFVSKNMTQYLQKQNPLVVIVENKPSKSRSRSRSKSASPKPASPNLAQKEKENRAKFLAKMKEQKASKQ